MGTVRDFAVPPVLRVRGALLEPHQGVASGTQGQAPDPVSPLLLRAVRVTKGHQEGGRASQSFRNKSAFAPWFQAVD